MQTKEIAEMLVKSLAFNMDVTNIVDTIKQLPPTDQEKVIAKISFQAVKATTTTNKALGLTIDACTALHEEE